jgi:3-hydroxy-3-methylglutaryl CoA synthase
MASILDIGIAIPSKRLNPEIYQRATQIPLNGERTVADYDEDSITLAYSAGSNILNDEIARRVIQIIFASTTPVYGEKSNSSIIATALDLNEHVHAMDLTASQNSMLSGMWSAVKSLEGEDGLSLIVSGEKRTGAPGSAEEANSGDAGAAVLIGNDDSGIAIIEDHYTKESNFMSTWRLAEHKVPFSSEQKFSMEVGFQKSSINCIKEFLNLRGIKPDSISALVLLAPDGKAQSAVFKESSVRTGKDEAEELFKKTGYCGTTTPVLLLAYLFEKLKEGERLLLCSFGDGMELILLRITGNKKTNNNLQAQLERKSPLSDYSEFLKLKGFIEYKNPEPFTSIPVLTREEDALLRLYARRCTECGEINYPPRRICLKCSQKDMFENIKLKKSGTIYTFTKDFVYPCPFPPTAMAVVDLDGGGSFYCQVVDPDKNDIHIGDRVKLTLRRLHEGGEFVHYFWKAELER